MVWVLGVAMRLTPQPGQIAAQLVVHAFDDVGLRFGLDELFFGEDGVVAPVVVGAVLDVRAARNLRTQRSGCAGVTIAQDPSEYAAGSAINSPPEPNCCFFEPT